MNLAECFLARLERDPSRHAFAGIDADSVADPASPRYVWQRSRADLLGAASAWAWRFEQTGLRASDRVALSPTRGPELAALHLAALASGLSVVPLNPSLAPAEVARLLPTVGAALVVSSAAVAAANQRTANALGLPWWVEDAAVDALPAPFEAPPTPPDSASRAASPGVVDRDDEDEAVLLLTSGTTGDAKSVPLSHGNLHANLSALAELWRRDEGDRLLHVLPANHFHGLVLGIYGSLLAGNATVMLDRFDARACLDAIQALDINLLMAVPTMYSRMLGSANERDSLAGLRLALSGSAPLAAELWHGFRRRFGLELVERYGLTETGIAASNPPGKAKPGSVGRAIAGTTIAICTGAQTGEPDCYLLPQPGRESPRGEVCVSGPSIMDGYSGDADSTAAAMRDGWFHTGDLGHFDGEGYLYIDGRSKELIIVGGSNVMPGEVAKVLAVVEGVAELAVAGVADPDLGEIVAAYVVPRADPDGGENSVKELERRLRDRAERTLARYKRPRRYFFLDELPRNDMGKIDRARLPSD
ncbi:MAG: class I adenylate-forming enzyme family protein [Candidatus Binatia bacterium]